MRKHFFKNWLTYLVFSLIICLGLAVMIALVVAQVAVWSWITGYLIGMIFFTTMIPMMSFSVRQLLKTENVYFYILLFLIRIGVIFVPFLFAIYLPDIFAIYGILVAVIPIGMFFLFRYYTDEKGIRKVKGGK